jgi:hypothetical protein
MEASEEGAACPAVPPRRRRRARAAVSAAVARCPMPLLCALFGGAAPKREVQRAFISISQSVEAVHPNSAVHPKGEDEPSSHVLQGHDLEARRPSPQARQR